MQPHSAPFDAVPANAGAWYRQPVLWLGAAILAASLAGCVWMIVLGARQADVPVDEVHPHTLLDMPMHAAEAGKRATGHVEGAQAPRSTDTAGAPRQRP